MLTAHRCARCLVLATLLAVAFRAEAGPPPEGLTARIDTLLAAPDLAGGIQGVVVRSLIDGSDWYLRNPDLLFMPASNQKLLTSAAALHLLGPEFTFSTRVYASAPPDGEGTVVGNLYLVGSGDPLLAERDLRAMALAVAKKGVSRVTGRLVADSSRFAAPLLGTGWSWDYLSDYYAAPVCALNLNKNTVRLRIGPGKSAGEPPTVVVEPSASPVQVVVTAATGASGSATALSVERRLGTAWIHVSGKVAGDAPAALRDPVAVTVPDPALYCSTVFTDLLRQAGVRIEVTPEAGTVPAEAVLLAEHKGLPLRDLLPLLNKPSDNLIAECLLRAVGAKAFNDGSVSAGARAAGEWFGSLGLPTGGHRMADGSGLSRLNYVSPRFLAGLLEAMSRHPHGAFFRDSLPVAGKDGTLRNRLRGTAAEGNLKAKTGYIGGVSSLSGYLSTRSGEPLLVVLLMNNHLCPPAAAREVQDKIVQLLAEVEGSLK